MITRFTTLVGCDVPLQQAAIGSLTNPELASAVSNAGALGMVCVYGMPPDGIAEILGATRARTPGPVGANFILNFMDPASLHDCVASAARSARVVEFFYSDPDPRLVQVAHSGGALVSWQVGSPDEARAAAGAGCDLIVAQGVEAGGHVRGRTGLIPLLDAVLEAVPDIPVLAAGGIGSGRAMAAALACGADGVRVGTRFVASTEAGAHPRYVDALIAAGPEDTLLSDTFNANWSNAPHRCLRASVEAAIACTDEFVAEVEDEETGEIFRIRRLGSFTPRAAVRGNIAAMPHWAGESVGNVRRVQGAAEIVRELADDCERRLGRGAPSGATSRS
ncbi:MAG TPA: nitronate monooxygenase [Candidatus Omnitrophota bacterium]|nr:nitronate monooxygenase [Candidatus Omnitrophota bacterium]